MSTKVVTGKVRLSFCHLFEPQVPLSGGDPKYSVTLLIPKSDAATVGKIQAAMEEAADNFRKKNGSASLPARPVNPLHDGDGLKDNGDPYGPECRGHYVLSVSCRATQKPVVVDAAGNAILDPAEVYSGCYGRASINFYGYSNVKKGIGAGLLAVQKLHDGEPFGTVGSADDFNDGFVDASGDSDDLPWMR
jgi:hypothetical protein